MCGIVGVWHLDGRAVNSAAIEAMRDALTHRGPDDAGLWLEGSVGLGHRRLSILDLSEAGRMPMASPDSAVQAVFNGEIYNFRDLRAELEAEGHRFFSETDSEVVLRAYEQWGVDCFDRFNGMFAVGIWDGRAQRMVLARDPAGQKPLYYAYRPGRWLLFASTLAPLVRYAGNELEIDEAVVKDYVRFGFPPDGRAMLADVRSLPPGSFSLTERGREPRNHRYFDLTAFAEVTPTRQGSEKDHLETFRETMREAVSARLVADVPLGAFLSGGLDSSLVVALMAEKEADAVQTYTIGFEQAEFDESQYAARIASHLGVQNTVRVLRGPDVLAQLPDLVRYFDEPMADYSVLPTLAVSKLAREHVTVALTGDGADEELGGYKYYLAQRAIEPYMQLVPEPLRAAVAKAARLVPNAGARRIVARSGASDPALFFGLGGFYRGATVDAVNRLLCEQNEAPKRVAEFLRAHPLGNSVEAGMLYDATHTLPHAWLHKVDRASMAVGLEARSPFLDRRVIELAFTLPLEMRIRGRHKKYLVRRLLREYLPAELVERPKQGFTAPVAHWLRNELREELENRLSTEMIVKRGFFDPKRAQMLVQEHLRGTHDHAQLLWALLVLEWWIAQQLEGDAGLIDYSRGRSALR
ncbi:MAG: asparagine synthase (glutamine-hydrolyzing) [Deltaproteobacteria bacterium]|nr:asparagine synthase (glutamine-hydrolyzing) [Deltaproteobacteria bacterium]NND30357.1 asparagine synthase (glutamine-hydrolyzing) [Myxococcales bacterium]MBT8466989.1 asparagine synthase (glutamine-hydrolyzing) [Deltaproteobacteria bacterium]MBT8480280.1 asparagine synthase (glutamine-hydrolyzing) [Deltaproteobacteria bacterium]NNK08578.1 asparagine synthase (glutamine-hydrolyzing) [Myxococcales bacterium]